MRWRIVWHQCHHQAFIILALLHPVGRCTLKSQCILISRLEIDAPMRIRLCNRLTTWQFIKQISGKAATWKQQLHLAHSCALSQFSADFDWGVGKKNTWLLSIERLKIKFFLSLDNTQPRNFTFFFCFLFKKSRQKNFSKRNVCYYCNLFPRD